MVDLQQYACTFSTLYSTSRYIFVNVYLHSRFIVTIVRKGQAYIDARINVARYCDFHLNSFQHFNHGG